MEQAAIIITAAEGAEFSKLSQVLEEYKILHLPVVDVQGKPVGIVTQDSLFRALKTSSQSLVNKTEKRLKPKNYPIPLKSNLVQSSEGSQFRILLQKRFIDNITRDTETALIAGIPNNEQPHLKSKVSPLKNSQNAIVSVSPTSEPTEEKLLLQAGLEKTGKAIIIADKAGKIIYCNQLASQLYNKKPQELLHQMLSGIIQTLNAQFLGEIEESLEHKETWEKEIALQRPDGTTYMAYFSYSLIKNAGGEIIGAIYTGADNTQKKQIEQVDGFSSCDKNFQTLINFTNPFSKPVVYQPWPTLPQNNQNYGNQNYGLLNNTVLSTKISSSDLTLDTESALTPTFSVSSLTSTDSENSLNQKDSTASSLVLASDDKRENFSQTQQQLEQVISATGVIIYKAEVSDTYIIKRISKNTAKVVGYEAQEIIENSRLWVSRIHPEDQQKIEKESLSPMKPKRSIDYRFLCKNGSYCWLRDEAQLMFDSTGTPTEIMGTWLDITDTKTLEEKTKKTTEKDLELSEMRRQFITTTSHEFRTPLCTILSSADLLELYIERGRTEKQKEHIDRIQASALRISNILNDILTTGKGIAGQIKCQPTSINLEEFCQTIIKQITTNFNICQNRIQFLKIENNYSSVSLDKTLLQQILFNLLSNAVKYSLFDAPIIFELGIVSGISLRDCQPKEGEPTNLSAENTVAMATFKIQDSGIGIPSTDQPHIYEPFYRGSNLNNEGGTGLGLTIVKQAVDIHKGEITLETEVDSGTTFTVSLPVFGTQET